MANSNNRADSSGKGEPAFCGVLREAIRSEFGSSKAFARHVGISESRTSQLLSGQEIASAPTLEYLLDAFSSVAVQARIQEAWVRSYAPSPVERIDHRDGPTYAICFLDSIPALTASGRSRPALRTVENLAVSVGDQDIRFRLARAAVELALVLDMPVKARQWARTLAGEAKRAQELGWVAWGLYLDMTVSRATALTSPGGAVKAYREFQTFLAAWDPSSDDGRAIRCDLRGAAIRDQALTALTLFERNPGYADALRDAVSRLDRFVGPGIDPVGQPIFLEVSGRLHLALGHIGETEDRWEGAETFKRHMAPMQAIKADILRGQIMVANGNRHGAEFHLLRTLDRAYDLDDLHHARVIERLLVRPEYSREPGG